VHAQRHDSPQDFKELLKDGLLLVKVRSYNSLFSFKSFGASFTENARIDEQVAKAREGVYTFCVQVTTCHHVRTLLPVESRTPNLLQLHFFDSGMEAPVNI
jgi:hypothetical protein